MLSGKATLENVIQSFNTRG